MHTTAPTESLTAPQAGGTRPTPPPQDDPVGSTEAPAAARPVPWRTAEGAARVEAVAPAPAPHATAPPISTSPGPFTDFRAGPRPDPSRTRSHVLRFCWESRPSGVSLMEKSSTTSTAFVVHARPGAYPCAPRFRKGAFIPVCFDKACVRASDWLLVPWGYYATERSTTPVHHGCISCGSDEGHEVFPWVKGLTDVAPGGVQHCEASGWVLKYAVDDRSPDKVRAWSSPMDEVPEAVCPCPVPACGRCALCGFVRCPFFGISFRSPSHPHQVRNGLIWSPLGSCPARRTRVRDGIARTIVISLIGRVGDARNGRDAFCVYEHADIVWVSLFGGFEHSPVVPVRAA